MAGRGLSRDVKNPEETIKIASRAGEPGRLAALHEMAAAYCGG
jgi:hypothetical protein